ncbi:MAG: hypothetical protein ACJAXK_002032 [Yoonia sp.]|jgi:hypothetical protein
MITMSDLDVMDGLTFETDRQGIIRDVGANNWNAFAIQNGAPELNAKAVLNCSLFDFIEGTQVQNQFRQIMERIALDPNWSWVLPFRCDCPDTKRNICQSLRPIFSGHECTGFIFQSIEQHSQQRPPIGLYDFKRLRKLAKEDSRLPVVMMCSWCQRVQYPPISGDEWILAEDYYVAGGRSEVRINHAICEDCLETTLRLF